MALPMLTESGRQWARKLRYDTIQYSGEEERRRERNITLCVA